MVGLCKYRVIVEEFADGTKEYGCTIATGKIILLNKFDLCENCTERLSAIYASDALPGLKAKPAGGASSRDDAKR